MNNNREALVQDLTAVGIWPASDGLRRDLYAYAAGETDLDAVEYQTIRDVCDLGELPEGDQRTALEAALMNLFLVRREGGLRMSLEPSRLFDRLAAAGPLAGLGNIFLQALKAGQYRTVIGNVGDAPYLPLVASADHLSFHRYRAAEDRLAAGLRARLTGHPVPLPTRGGAPDWPTILDKVLADMPLGGSGKPMRLDDQQQLAVKMALVESFAVITGGPGTGKTSIVFTLLRCLLRAGVRPGRIGLAAPTGRAAQRLGESLRGQLGCLPNPTPEEAVIPSLDPRTLHRLLGYSPTRLAFSHTAENPLDIDFLLVDETSMVDTELMSCLLEATQPSTRVILVGDKDQLPSVEAGSVLADLVGNVQQSTFTPARFTTLLTAGAVTKPKGRSRRAAANPGDAAPAPVSTRPDIGPRIVVLETCYRSDKTILEAAKAVNTFDDTVGGAREQLLARFPRVAAGTLSWQTPDWAPKAFRDFVETWITDFCEPTGTGPQADSDYRQAILACVRAGVPASGDAIEAQHPVAVAFKWLTCRKLLTVFRDGVCGVNAINRVCAAHLRHRLTDRSPADGRAALRDGHGEMFFPGAVVMVTRNDYRLDLFNGDTGLILPARGGSLYGVFPRPGTVLRVAIDELPGPELAFATTVHKGQGSEYDHVTLVLPPAPGITAQRLLTRQIVYTGLTRAKSRATLLADEATLLQACSRQHGGE